VQIDLGQEALAIGKAEQLPLVAALQHEAQESSTASSSSTR
jgi:hypothetical protein